MNSDKQVELENKLDLIKKELIDLVMDIKNNDFIEKNEIILRLENIINISPTLKCIKKPNPIINKPVSSDLYEINKIIKTDKEHKELDEFLDLKKKQHDELIKIHENNLEQIPLQINKNVDLINDEDNECEETYLSPIFNNSTYIQLKKFN